MVEESLELIREAIADILRDSGYFQSVEPYPDAKVGALPAAQLGFPQGRFELGMSTEVVFYDMPLTLFVALRGEYAQELKVAESLIPRLVRLMHTNMSLDGLVDRCVVSSFATGVFKHGGIEYTGFLATLEIKERNNVALGG